VVGSIDYGELKKNERKKKREGGEHLGELMPS